MIRVLAYTKEKTIVTDLTVHELLQEIDRYLWYWVDFEKPTNEEKQILSDKFQFHSLALKDCFHYLQRPKLDHYDDYHFLVLNSFQSNTLKPLEIDIFTGQNFVVSFHYHQHVAIDQVWERVVKGNAPLEQGIHFILYKILDKLVDSFFPIAQQCEDKLTHLETRPLNSQMSNQLDQVFQVRKDLLKLRHIIWPMRDLIYRIISSHHIAHDDELKRYMLDIQDHIHKLSSMIDSSREMASDIRDNYISLNSNRMNAVMMRLTLIATIFMPLTFVAGVYGMNFENMPELKNPFGYFIVLGIMVIVAVLMYIEFRKKGWFNQE